MPNIVISRATRRLAAAAVLCAMVGACGQTAELKPRAGHELPVAPFGRGDRPSANDLLAPRPQDAPQRSVELRSRSEDRQDDPFDLPPQDSPPQDSPPQDSPSQDSLAH